MYIKQENNGWLINIKKVAYKIFNQKINNIQFDIKFTNQAIHENKKHRIFEVME